MDRVTGKVKWFNEKKGWGFIQQDNGPDIFLHHSNIEEEVKVLKESDRVSFLIEEVKDKPGKYKAIDVRLEQKVTE